MFVDRPNEHKTKELGTALSIDKQQGTTTA
jgi:hypothetical protein